MPCHVDYYYAMHAACYYNTALLLGSLLGRVMLLVECIVKYSS
jgi:hypothetical protein